MRLLNNTQWNYTVFWSVYRIMNYDVLIISTTYLQFRKKNLFDSIDELKHIKLNVQQKSCISKLLWLTVMW